MKIVKTLAWVVMTCLALAIAGYSGAISIGFRPSFAQAIFAAMPITATTHFSGGAIALAVGAFQVNSRIRRRFPSVHRWLGRLYVVAVTLGGIAAFLLAMRSHGGSFAHFGFGLLAASWVGSTLNAYHHIRARRWEAHRDWMVRSYALTYAAVTLRIYLPASLMAGIPFHAAYPTISWFCWVPNLLVAECYMWWSRHSRVYSGPITRSTGHSSAVRVRTR